jgi:hypothetical protein
VPDGPRMRLQCRRGLQEMVEYDWGLESLLTQEGLVAFVEDTR